MIESKCENNAGKQKMCLLIADITAMIIFSTVPCLFVEVLVAKLTLFQSIRARIAAVPFNLITGRPYGWYRDKIFLGFHVDGGNPWKFFFADTLAFLTFQIPLYVIILLTAGATWKQIALSSASMSVFLCLTGRPYGIFLEFCRRTVGKIMGL